MTSFDINVEDFQSAVDFLISLDNVDSDKTEIIGICGWGVQTNTSMMNVRLLYYSNEIRNARSKVENWL